MFYSILYSKDIDIIILLIVLSCMFFIEVCTEADWCHIETFNGTSPVLKGQIPQRQLIQTFQI